MAVVGAGGGAGDDGGGGDSSTPPREAAPVGASGGSYAWGRRTGEGWVGVGGRGGGEGLGLRVVFEHAFGRLVAEGNMAASKPRSLLLEAHFGRDGGQGAGGGIPVAVVERLVATADPLALLDTHLGHGSARNEMTANVKKAKGSAHQCENKDGKLGSMATGLGVAYGLNEREHRLVLRPRLPPKLPPQVPPKVPGPPKVPTPPKVPAPPRVPAPARPAIVISAIISGVARSRMYKYLVDQVKKLFEDWVRIGIFMAIGITIGRSVYKLRQEYEAMAINEIIPGRVALVVTDDIFEHGASRRCVVKMLQRPNSDLEAIIPSCVIEGLCAQWESAGPDSFKATAALNFVIDLVSRGNAQVASDEWVWEHHLNGRQIYEERVLNTAITFSHAHTNTTAFIITNSETIRGRATAQNIRSATPAMLMKWRPL